MFEKMSGGERGLSASDHLGALVAQTLVFYSPLAAQAPAALLPIYHRLLLYNYALIKTSLTMCLLSSSVD